MTTTTATTTLIAICAGCGQSAFGGALSLTRRCADCARDAGECKSCGAPISAAALDIDGLCNGENAACIDRYYEDPGPKPPMDGFIPQHICGADTGCAGKPGHIAPSDPATDPELARWIAAGRNLITPAAQLTREAQDRLLQYGPAGEWGLAEL